MYFPNQFKKRTGQLFLLGIITGAIIAYILFSFMYGKMYGELLERNLALNREITELKERNEALLQDKKDIDELTKGDISVQSIELSFLNPSELKLDRLMLHQFEDILLKEISHIIGQDIRVLSENNQLLISTIENKTITLYELSYSFEVTQLIISQKVKITLNVKLA